MKLVLNKCYGGYGLSAKAIEMLQNMGTISNKYDYWNLDRENEDLVTVVEVLGADANDEFAKLTIVEIPDTYTDWEFDEYDGFESVTYVVDGKLHHA